MIIKTETHWLDRRQNRGVRGHLIEHIILSQEDKKLTNLNWNNEKYAISQQRHEIEINKFFTHDDYNFSYDNEQLTILS